MIKQIAMVGILGLALVLATAAIYTQSSFAIAGIGPGLGPGQLQNTGTGGPPGLGIASGTPAENSNPILGGGATGAAPSNGGCGHYEPCPT